LRHSSACASVQIPAHPLHLIGKVFLRNRVGAEPNQGKHAEQNHERQAAAATDRANFQKPFASHPSRGIPIHEHSHIHGAPSIAPFRRK